MLIAGQMPVQAAGSKVSVRMAGTYGQTEARKITSMVNEFRTGNEAWYWNSDDQTKTTCKNLKKLKALLIKKRPMLILKAYWFWMQTSGKTF